MCFRDMADVGTVQNSQLANSCVAEEDSPDVPDTRNDPPDPEQPSMGQEEETSRPIQPVNNETSLSGKANSEQPAQGAVSNHGNMDTGEDCVSATGCQTDASLMRQGNSCSGASDSCQPEARAHHRRASATGTHGALDATSDSSVCELTDNGPGQPGQSEEITVISSSTEKARGCDSMATTEDSYGNQAGKDRVVETVDFLELSVSSGEHQTDVELQENLEAHVNNNCGPVDKNAKERAPKDMGDTDTLADDVDEIMEEPLTLTQRSYTLCKHF